MNGDWHRVGAGLAVRFAMAEGRIDAECERMRRPCIWRSVLFKGGFGGAKFYLWAY